MKRLLPSFVLVVSALWLAAGFLPERPVRGFDLQLFASLPVLHEGRVKPFDSVARSTLLLLRGKQSAPASDRTLGPVEWALEAMTHPAVSDALPVFQIDDPDTLGLLGIEARGRSYAFNDLMPRIEEISKQAERAEAVESGLRSRFQTSVWNLHQKMLLYHRLKNTLQLEGTKEGPAELEAFRGDLAVGLKALAAHQRSGPFDRKALETLAAHVDKGQFLDRAALFFALPPVSGESPEGWRSVGTGLLAGLKGETLDPILRPWAEALAAYQVSDSARFTSAAAALSEALEARGPLSSRHARRETLFNRTQPFYRGMVLYVLALLLALLSWGFWEETLRKSAFLALAAAFAVHTAGLAGRMLLEGRPPVTNLYSSAVFVGWVVVALALVLERMSRRGVGTAVAGAAGFATLIIAHHLAAAGDTMEVMRAVLDSNFWLGTHVVAITVGYSGTFLAGFLAHVYIFRGLLTRSLGEDDARDLVRMTYGTVCFSLFASFIGTVLGGIWADQSWGRFWGWDPKENGALLIVLWNAVILHARWSGLARERGLMVMAVFGNILTSLSWFGVNMLGIGLHSYGFMDKAFYWLAAFIVSQLAVMSLGALPLQRWRSFRSAAPVARPPRPAPTG